MKNATQRTWVLLYKNIASGLLLAITGTIFWSAMVTDACNSLVMNQVLIRDCSLLELTKSSRRIAVLGVNTYLVYSLFF